MLPTLGRVWQRHCGFVETSICISDKCYICLIEQIQTMQEIQSYILTNKNAFIRPAPGSEASTRHSKKMSVFDGVNKNKCLGDIVGTLFSCLPRTRQ